MVAEAGWCEAAMGCRHLTGRWINGGGGPSIELRFQGLGQRQWRTPVSFSRI
jgi:hypothetical protein